MWYHLLCILLWYKHQEVNATVFNYSKEAKPGQNQVSDYKSKAILFSVFDLFSMCFISFVPVRAICDMIGMGISSSLLIQIRSEGFATWDLVGTDKPFGCTMKTAHPDTVMGNITT